MFSYSQRFYVGFFVCRDSGSKHPPPPPTTSEISPTVTAFLRRRAQVQKTPTANLPDLKIAQKNFPDLASRKLFRLLRSYKMKLTTKKLHKLIQEELLLENQVAHGLMSDNPKLVMKYLSFLDKQNRVTYRIEKGTHGPYEQTEVYVHFFDDELFDYVIKLYNKMSHKNMNINYVIIPINKLHMLWLED